jgi:hypothetical protein
MGGIVNLYTASPLSRQGTKVRAAYGNANTISATATHARKLDENVGLSLGGSYNQTDGFFTNRHNGGKADALKSGAARLRLDWKMGDRLRLSYTLSGEYSWQNGYPYGLTDSTGKVHDPSYNAPSGYKRALMNSGLFLLYSGEGYTLSSSASYQRFDDHMQLDQDFTPEDLFTLEQKQKQHALTEEIVLKSQGEKSYQWLFGAFGFYKGLNTEAPVNIDTTFLSKNFPRVPRINYAADSGSSTLLDHLHIPSNFESTTYGFAAYHQSTYNNLLIEGLSITAGIRLDYEKVALQYYSTAATHLMLTMPGGTKVWMPTYPKKPLYNGKVSNDFLEFLPKVALQYIFGNGKYKTYASASKGYTAGGYNTNLFAGLVEDKLKPIMPIIGRNISYKQPESSETVNSAIYYNPEYSWSYEIGGSASLFDKQLSVNAATFFVDTRNQQIAQFVPSGLGRVMKNAGHSQSYGAEISLSGRIGNLSGHLAYGYTHATFKQYADSVKAESGAYQEVDYKGSFVPFAPQHTLSVGAEYSFIFNGKILDKFTLGATYNGAGKIYYTAANESIASQDFYGLLNARAAVEKGIFRLGLWGKNLLNADYKTFYFESSITNGGFAQRGRPVQLGVDISIRF